MKKLTILLFAASTVLFAQDYERDILVEIFTNSHCPLCPAAHSTFDSYLANSQNASRVNYIFYHMSFPYSDDPLNQANRADASGRNSYYGPYSSTPKGFFDGAIQSNNYSLWGAGIDSRLAVKSPVKLKLSGSRQGQDITINADATFDGSGSFGSSVIHFVVVEDVNYTGRNGISNHKHVMRRMITTPTGESIQTSGTQSVSKTTTLDQSWNSLATSVVVFVQNSDTKEVYQSATIDYSELGLTDVEDNPAVVNEFSLKQNYPNPFNPATTIDYSIPFVERNSVTLQRTNRFGESIYNVSLKVYDILGTEISTLVNKQQAPGNYKVEFNASKLPSGIYFYKLTYGTRSITKKMTLIK